MRIKMAVLALTLALAVCTAACDGGSASPANTAQPAGPASLSSSSSGTQPSSGGTRSPSGSIRLSTGSAASVVSWYHGRGGAAFTSLTKVLDHVSRAEASGGATAFGRTCPQIASAVSTAQGEPPIPAATAAAWYTKALAGYQESVTDCENGVSTHNTGTLRLAEAEVNAADVDLNKAAAILITALSGA
jgi:hypothetical protein